MSVQGLSTQRGYHIHVSHAADGTSRHNLFVKISSRGSLRLKCLMSKTSQVACSHVKGLSSRWFTRAGDPRGALKLRALESSRLESWSLNFGSSPASCKAKNFTENTSSIIISIVTSINTSANTQHQNHTWQQQQHQHQHQHQHQQHAREKKDGLLRQNRRGRRTTLVRCREKKGHYD